MLCLVAPVPRHQTHLQGEISSKKLRQSMTFSEALAHKAIGAVWAPPLFEPDSKSTPSFLGIIALILLLLGQVERGAVFACACLHSLSSCTDVLCRGMPLLPHRHSLVLISDWGRC